MNDQIPKQGTGTVVREVPENPVVRDSVDNPVVRELDLVKYVQPVKDTVNGLVSSVQVARWEGRIGMTIVGALSALGPTNIGKIANSLQSAPPPAPGTLLLHLLNHL